MTEQTPAKRETHDPRVLRAIAHPTRNRILTELSAGGPMRAADVAAELGMPANQASFHLRTLAKYGLVEEDPGAARDRRDRVWRLTQQQGYTIDLGEIEKAPGGKAASTVFRRTAAARAHTLVDVAFDDDRDPEIHRSVIDQALKLTKAEAAELTDELAAVLARWNERTRGLSEDRRTYVVFQVIQPFAEDGPAEHGPGEG